MMLLLYIYAWDRPILLPEPSPHERVACAFAQLTLIRRVLLWSDAQVLVLHDRIR